MTQRPEMPVKPEVRPVDSAGELLRVGWDRSWRFTPILQRDTPEKKTAAASWTWQWLIVGWLAVCLLPAVLLDVCAQSTHIRIVDGASALARLSAKSSARRARGAAAVGVPTFLVLLGFVLLCIYGSEIGWWPAWVAGGVWFAAVLVLLVAHRRAPKQGKLPVLLARAGALAGGGRSGFAVADVVASKDRTGLGNALMVQLQQQWAAEGAVAVLYAASPTLVGYYQNLGWGIDEGGDGRRMIFPAGLDRSGAVR